MAQTLFMNRRGTEPYARWCERTGEATPLPTRFENLGPAALSRLPLGFIKLKVLLPLFPATSHSK